MLSFPRLKSTSGMLRFPYFDQGVLPERGLCVPSQPKIKRLTRSRFSPPRSKRNAKMAGFPDATTTPAPKRRKFGSGAPMPRRSGNAQSAVLPLLVDHTMQIVCRFLTSGEHCRLLCVSRAVGDVAMKPNMWTQLDLGRLIVDDERCPQKRRFESLVFEQRAPLQELRVKFFGNSSLHFDGGWPSELPHLTSLVVSMQCHQPVMDMKVLTRCQRLETLSVHGFHQPELRPLSGCHALRTLSVTCGHVDLNGVCLPALHTLRLNYTTTLLGISSLSSCVALRHLDLSWCGSSVYHLGALSGLSLEWLDVSNTWVSDLTPLSSEALSQSLQTLIARGTLVHDLTPISSCSALTHLDLRNSREVGDITALSSCLALSTLRLSRTQTSDLSPLSRCWALRILDLE